MELRAVAGLQHGGGHYLDLLSVRGVFSVGSSVVVPRLGKLSLWRNPRVLNRRGARGARGGVLVWKCSSEAGREADSRRWVVVSLTPGSRP